MNNIYRIIYSMVLGRWIVASEFAKGKTKSSISGKKSGKSTLRNVLSGLVLLPVFYSCPSIADVNLTANWNTTNNNGLGAVTINGTTANIIGPNSVYSAGSGAIRFNVEQGKAKGYITSGDDLTGLSHISTGTKTKTISIWDNETGAYKTVQVFDNVGFSERAAGSSGDETFSGFTPTADFFYKTRFVTTTNGGTANINVGAGYIGSNFKDTQLAVADGVGSSVNWISENQFYFQPAATTSSGIIYHQSIDSIAYTDIFTDILGKQHQVNSLTDFQQYNQYLIDALINGTLTASQYDTEFNRAIIKTTHDYEIDRTAGGTIDSTPYEASTGLLAALYASNNATATLTSTGKFTGVLPGYGNGAGIVARTKGTGINEGVIDAIGTAMRAYDNSTIINNGTIYVWDNNPKYSLHGEGMVVISPKSIAINNGIINIRPFKNSSVNPYGINTGMIVGGGGTGTNNSTINITADASTVDSKGKTVGVRVNKDGTFTNATQGKITVGIGADGGRAHSAVGSMAIEVLQGATQVVNVGLIYLGEGAQGNYGIAASNAGVVDVTNSGTITIEGHDSDTPALNVGIYANNSSGLKNTGIINVNGLNSAGILAENGGSLQSSGTIDVGGIDISSGFRNFGVWVEGAGSAIDVSGLINLGGVGVVGVFAKDGGELTLSGAGSVEFNNTNQVGFYVYGDGSAIHNIGTGSMDVSTENSTLFRIANGANFQGNVGASSTLTASGKNSFAIVTTGKSDMGIAANLQSGGMTINLIGEGATGILVEGGAEGVIESNATINMDNASAIAGIADGNGYDISGNLINPNDASTKLTASAQLMSSQDKVTGYIARNGATLDNAGNITFTGKNTVGIQVQDGSVGENTGSIILQDGGVGLMASSSNLATTINNTGNLTLKGGSNANRTKGINASGSAVTVNMTAGFIDMQGQGAIGVEAFDGGKVILTGTALPQFAAEGTGVTDQIAFRVVGSGASILTNVQAGTLLDASGNKSTLFRIEDGAAQSGILQMKTSGTDSNGIWATGKGTTVVASSGSDFQVLGAGAKGVYITGAAEGTLKAGTSVNLVGNGAVVGMVDGNEYDLAGNVIAENTGSKLTNESNISTSLNDAIGFITQYQGLLVNKGSIDFTAGSDNIGVKVIDGKFENVVSDIAVNGVAVYVEGEQSKVTSTGGIIKATDGEAAIKLANGASLNLSGSGLGIVEAQGSAHGILLDTGAKGLVIAGAKINVNADSTTDPTVKTSTGNGIENKAEIAGLQLTGTTEINVADGKGIRTAATLAKTNSGTINISGSGTGLAFETATGGVVDNASILDMSDSKELVINLNSTGGTGILANTMDGATVKSGASVNVTQADGGSALVVKNAAAEVVQSGNLISSSTTASVVEAQKAKRFTNKGQIIANSVTAEAMSFDGTTNTTLVNDTGAEIQGVIAMNGGNNNVTNKGLITGTLTAADGNNTVLFDDGSTLTGEVTLGQGNNQVTLNGTAHVDEVTAGSGINTFTIKGTGATYNLLDGGVGTQDSLIFDAATHTIAQAATLQNFEYVKLKNKSTVTVNEALILTDGGVGAGTVDIESGSEMAIKPTLVGDFAFDPLLTGKGLLSVGLDADTSAFDFTTNVGNTFAGTLKLGLSQFDLSDLNTTSLTAATLQTDTGNITTVGTGVQNIGGLTFSGGKLIFGSIMPGDKVSENSIVTSAAGTLDLRGTGTVQVTMPTEVINDVPAIDSRKSLFEQDDETTLVKLVTALGSVVGTGSAITLKDDNGNVISNAQTFDITQHGTVVAEGTYDYKLMNGEGNTVDGLYIGYGLTQLDLQGTLDDALILTPNAGATGKSADLSAKVTGTGDLAIEAGPQTVSLSNQLNDYSGETTVRNGTLVMANDNVLGKTANLVVENGATFNTTDGVGRYSQTIGALNTVDGASVVLAEGSALTISDTQRTAGVTEGGTIANGTLSGAGELNVVASELVVNGANAAYTGDVNLSGTALATLDGAQGLGTQGTINFAAADDRLDINIDPLTGHSTNLSKSLAGDGLVTVQNVTDLTVSGDNTDFNGVFSVESGAALRASEQKHLGSSLIENQGVTYLTADAKWELENSITGTGALVKQGADRLIINHELAYTSETTVEAGTLIIGDSVADATARTLSTGGLLSGSSKVNVNGGAVLSGLGDVTGEVDNQGTIAALNALAGYESAEASNLNVGALTNSGVIQLAGKNIGNTLTVNGDYTGGGTLVINTVLDGDDSATDKLIVTGNTSGETGVIVNNIKGKGQQTVNGIEVVNVGGLSEGTFKLNNRAVAGAYEYFLHKDGVATEDGNWYLRSALSTPGPTPSDKGDKVYRPEAGSYMANMAAANTLFNLRLEDRDGRAENSSLWLRQVGSHTNFRDTSGQLKTSTNSYVVQGGGEVFSTQFAANDRLGLGVMLGYGKADSHTDSRKSQYSSKGSVDGYNAGLYATWYQDAQSLNGAYVDSWVNYSWLDASVNGEQLSIENYDISGYSASIETGYRQPVYQGLNGHVFITPQAQVIWNGLHADDHTEFNGTQVKSGGSDNVQTRLGVKISRDGVSDADKGKDKLFTVYTEANWIYNSQLVGTTMDGVDVQQAGSRNIGELKVGAEGQLNKQANLWANVAQQLGDDGYSDTSVVVGFKYKF